MVQGETREPHPSYIGNAQERIISQNHSRESINEGGEKEGDASKVQESGDDLDPFDKPVESSSHVSSVFKKIKSFATKKHVV